MSTEAEERAARSVLHSEGFKVATQIASAITACLAGVIVFLFVGLKQDVKDMSTAFNSMTVTTASAMAAQLEREKLFEYRLRVLEKKVGIADSP